MKGIDKQWLDKNKGKVIGTGIGMFMGFIFLFAGFWKMVLFSFLVGIGYLIGYQLDRKEDMKELLDTILLDKWMRK